MGFDFLESLLVVVKMQDGCILTSQDVIIDLFTDKASILNSIVSNIYYGMLRGQISMYLPSEHPIIAIWNNGIQNGRRIGKKVYFTLRTWKEKYLYVL